MLEWSIEGVLSMDISTAQSIAVTDWFHEERKKRGLTQQDVSLKTGIHRTRVADLEKSFTINTRFIDVARLARFYGMDLNELARRLGM